MSYSVSYIIAAYNEELIIEKAVRICHAALSSDFEDFELILVDDGSMDDTGRIMDELSHELHNIKVMHNMVNLNFGISVLRAMKAAAKDLIFYNAADLLLDPRITKTLADEMPNFDLLVLQRGKVKTARWRKFTSAMNYILLHLLFPRLMKGTPIMSFGQVIRREIIDSIIPLARSPIFTWPEMVFRAKMNPAIRVGNKPVEVNVDRFTRKGAFGKPHDIIWGFYDMLRFRLRSWGGSI